MYLSKHDELYQAFLGGIGSTDKCRVVIFSKKKTKQKKFYFCDEEKLSVSSERHPHQVLIMLETISTITAFNHFELFQSF